MKNAQWTGAILALAGMVFAITFAMNYLGGGGRQPGPSKGPEGHVPRDLFFESRAAPPDKSSMLECEVQTPGHYDFWFSNPNDEVVPVGLVKVDCGRCTRAELFVAPDGLTRRIGYAAGSWGVGPGGALPLLAFDALALPAVQARAKGQEVTREKSIEVPPGAFGWVRLHWNDLKEGTKMVSARLWVDVKERPAIDLQAAVASYPPLRVPKVVRLGSIHAADLPVTRDFECLSATRRSLKLKVWLARARRADPTADPFVLGKPRPLSPRELEARNKPPSKEGLGERVLCGYKIPITLRALAADGKTPFDLGHFRRTVILTDENDNKVTVTVAGRVRGVVEVGDGEGDGGVQLTLFSRSKGSKWVDVPLLSTVDGLKLTPDTNKTARFLQVKLIAEKEERRRAWTLKVRVPPGKAEGRFPRPEDPAYEDSAVYLKAQEKGKPARYIRIPVVGTASDD